MALTNKLENIGNAIRNKTGKTDKLTLDEMVTEISAIETGGGSGDLPEELLNISGDCSYKFYGGNWDWFINEYGEKVITKDITNASYMFNGTSAKYCKAATIPFEFNFSGNVSCKNMFDRAITVQEIGNINNLSPKDMTSMFANCYKLKQLPEFVNFDATALNSNTSAYLSSMFSNCYSLRNIPSDWLSKLYSASTGMYYSLYYQAFDNCCSLDEIKGLAVQRVTLTSNCFSKTFDCCHRVKDIVFDVQDDGTPYTVSWKSQVIDLSGSIGYAPNGRKSYIINYNSGIKSTYAVSDDVTYQALKNNDDWFTEDVAYSRYNHDSVVNTINSLPDTSAYLATQSGATNTIKFTGDAGSLTDGGAINTLTETEIAVATSKGFTVTFV